MSECYFQTKRREKLAEVREQYAEIQRNDLEAGPDYIRHEKKYPGRIAKFMDRATDHLDEAERMIPAMAPGPKQKTLWIAFCKTLELADHCARQALWDPTVQRDIARQEGTRKTRHPEINEWIEKQLRRQKDAKSPELWNRRPEDIANPRKYEPIKYEAFARRVTAARGKLGLKIKKQR